jgi:hypothetical protein
MGHSSPRAALIYLDATRERDQKIAAGMGKLFTDAKKTGPIPSDRARNAHAVRPEQSGGSGT